MSETRVGLYHAPKYPLLSCQHYVVQTLLKTINRQNPFLSRRKQDTKEFP